MDEAVKKSFRDLTVWQRSMDLVELVYGITPQFVDAENTEMISGLKTTSISIPVSIADGFGRKSNIENLRCLYAALGSVHSLDTQIELTIRMRMVSMDVTKDALELCAEIEKMLLALTETLRERIKR